MVPLIEHSERQIFGSLSLTKKVTGDAKKKSAKKGKGKVEDKRRPTYIYHYNDKEQDEEQDEKEKPKEVQATEDVVVEQRKLLAQAQGNVV